jgi:hypothetical protein
MDFAHGESDLLRTLQEEEEEQLPIVSGPSQEEQDTWEKVCPFISVYTLPPLFIGSWTNLLLFHKLAWDIIGNANSDCKTSQTCPTPSINP